MNPWLFVLVVGRYMYVHVQLTGNWSLAFCGMKYSQPCVVPLICCNIIAIFVSSSKLSQLLLWKGDSAWSFILRTNPLWPLLLLFLLFLKSFLRLSLFCSFFLLTSFYFPFSSILSRFSELVSTRIECCSLVAGRRYGGSGQSRKPSRELCFNAGW